MKTKNVLLLFLPIAFSLVVFFAYFRPITAFTQDLGRHLLLGNIILETGSVPKTNLFSYTHPDFPFINTHYLSEVIFYVVTDLFGLTGLLLLMALLATATFSMLFILAIRRVRMPLLTCAVSLLFLPLLFERTDLRPEIFSFFLTSVFLVILYRYRKAHTRLIFLLIPLMFLWVNLHIYFILGIALIGIFLIDLAVEHRRSLRSRRVLLLCLVLLGACAATLLNPNGIQGALYPFRVLENYGYTIEENQTVFFLEGIGFTKPSFPYLKFSVLLLGIVLTVNIKRAKPVDWLLFLAGTYLAFSAVRNIPLFALLTLIPLIDNAAILIRKLPHPSQHRLRLLRAVALLAIIVLLLLRLQDNAQRGIDPAVPQGAKAGVDFFVSNNLSGPIYNNFDIGSYLIYRLYPKERVFVDGRPEAYPKDFFQSVYIPMQEDEAVFAEQDKQYNFQTIFFSHTDQTPWAQKFLTSILRNPRYSVVYLDDTIIILLKNNERHAQLIRRYAMTEEAVRIHHYDPDDKQSLLQLASFFNKVGWVQKEEELYQAVLRIDPTNCPVLYNLGIRYAERQDPAIAVIQQRYLSACR